MKNVFEMFKTTALGGLLFLVPLAVALVVIGKLVSLMRAAAQPFEAVLPVDSALGVLAVNLAALFVVVLFCFGAGLAASRGFGKRLSTTVESALLNAIPGYAFVKGFTDSMAQSDEIAGSFVPVVVRLDDMAQIAFEVERTERGNVVLYMPGAPNPWSGTVAYVTEDRVERLEMTVAEAVGSIRVLGRGSGDVASRLLGATAPGS